MVARSGWVRASFLDDVSKDELLADIAAVPLPVS
jgi:hypothetical protein